MEFEPFNGTDEAGKVTRDGMRRVEVSEASRADARTHPASKIRYESDEHELIELQKQKNHLEDCLRGMGRRQIKQEQAEHRERGGSLVQWVKQEREWVAKRNEILDQLRPLQERISSLTLRMKREARAKAESDDYLVELRKQTKAIEDIRGLLAIIVKYVRDK